MTPVDTTWEAIRANYIDAPSPPKLLIRTSNCRSAGEDQMTARLNLNFQYYRGNCRSQLLGESYVAGSTEYGGTRCAPKSGATRWPDNAAIPASKQIHLPLQHTLTSEPWNMFTHLILDF